MASAYAIRAASAEALAASATVAGSQITGAISTATLPATGLTGTLSTAQIANASVTAAKLASNSCTNGQVLQYNGSAWVCATPAASSGGGTVTSITAGSGLTGGTITTTGTIGLGTVPVANGGTGQTSLTSNGVVIGQGSGAVSATAAGAAGQVLTGTGATPAWTDSPTLNGNLSLGGTTAAATRLDVSGSGWFRADANGLPASAAQGVRVFFDTVLGTGSVFAYDYGASSPLNLTLQSPGGNVGIGTATPGSRLTVAGTVESTSGGFKFPGGATQTKALADCSAESDVAVMHNGAWVCRSTLGYVDNGDGTITDNKTGLMWEQKAACGAPDLTNPRCVNNTYTWNNSSPFTTPTGTLYTDFLPRLNQESTDVSTSTCFAGHCDWRIPRLSELKTILASCAIVFYCLDPIFGPTQSGYWSYTSSASNSFEAWRIDFKFGGGASTFGKGGIGFARAVRGVR